MMWHNRDFSRFFTNSLENMSYIRIRGLTQLERKRHAIVLDLYISFDDAYVNLSNNESNCILKYQLFHARIQVSSTVR